MLVVDGTSYSYKVQPQRYKHETIIGRSEGSTMKPDIDLSAHNASEMGVSRLHVALQYNAKNNLLSVSDMKSANGTFINGQKLYPQEVRVLRDGDELRLGRLVLRVYFQHGDRKGSESEPRNIGRRLAQRRSSAASVSAVANLPQRRQRRAKLRLENVKRHPLIGLAQVVLAIIPALRRQRDQRLGSSASSARAPRGSPIRPASRSRLAASRIRHRGAARRSVRRAHADRRACAPEVRAARAALP